ncbi:MAG: hypothetical protein C0490_17085 [Marivirga sp.]|nr:hypothetical protein [Marivirga sp.]
MKKNIVNKKTGRKPSTPKRSGVKEPEASNWTGSYTLTEHWQSDLMFFADEMRFFRSLIDRYFMALIEQENMEKTRGMARNLADLENERLQLVKKTAGHLKHLAVLVENPFSHDVQTTLNEHQETEKALADFVKRFHLVKKDIFKLMEHVMVSEKARHLLGS